MPLIVCTGVNGFIGNNLCEKILSSTSEELGFPEVQNLRFSNFDLQKKYDSIEVLGSDLSQSLSRDISKRFLGSARYTYCDYESLIQTLENLQQTPDVIIHNGACSSTTETDKEIFNQLNFEYSKKVWHFCHSTR